MRHETKFNSPPMMRIWQSTYALKRLELEGKIPDLDRGKIAKLAKQMEDLVTRFEANNTGETANG
tara:strand:+ start:4575 stop:4769 length:195 start_codon:yes stop_codon:yes gene_type:complete